MPAALADLHVHTTASDGAFAPAEIVAMAVKRGLAALAITDHDTMAGYEAAIEPAREAGLKLIPGVELSTRWVARGVEHDAHLLAYGIDPEEENLKAYLASHREERLRRAAAVTDRLNALGVSITLEDVLAKADGGAVGRPHIAQAMVQAGAVSSLDEAFTLYLRDGGPAYVPKNDVVPEVLANLVHGAGGVLVLAHPGPHLPPAVFRRLVSAGLDGIEATHPSHSEGVVRFWVAMARSNHLIATGGSDFHGHRKVEFERFGRLGLNLRRLERLEEVIAKMASAA